MSEKVCVLMSSYNGEKYIEQQILSILGQKEVLVQLLIRDDGSSDSTIDIISRIQSQHKEVEVILGKNEGPEKSFYNLMKIAYEKYNDIEYYAFADQDDWWMDLKLSAAIDYLEKFPAEVPNLYYSNLKVVDETLKYKYKKFESGYVRNTIKSNLSEICAWGCTCVFNRNTLTEIIKVDVTDYTLHDNWIVWVSMFLGNCIYDEKSYILYRQHNDNVSGQVKKGFKYILNQLSKIKFISTMKPEFEFRARLFLEMYNEKIKPEDRRLLLMIAEYRNNMKFKFELLFGNSISSGHPTKEIARRTRILLNRV